MKKVYIFVLFSLFLSACDDNDNDRHYTSGIQGDWITDCRTQSDGTSKLISYTFDTSSSGNDFFITGYSSYANSNCSGSSNIIILGGDLFYSGDQATPVCMAEKIDLFVTSADDSDTVHEGTALDDFLLDNNLEKSNFDIACDSGNRLFLGLNTETLDGSSNARRPIEMDTSIVFYATNTGAAKVAKEDQTLAVQESSIDTAKARMKRLLLGAGSEK